MEREPVSVSDDVTAQAARRFPVGGSAEGAPTLAHFEHGPLAAACEYFSRRFEDAPQPVAGVAIRLSLTNSPFFGPIAFFAIRTTDGIEIVSFTDDPDYWEIVDDDPG